MIYKILVVDDEQDFLDSVRRGLITSGYKNVRLESDPKEAAAAFERGAVFDVAIIDITMPGMDGVELLGVIKDSSPETECIMVTAVNDVHIAVECIKKGAFDYLTKPISREDLILKMNRALERKRLLEILSVKGNKSPPALRQVEAFRDIVTGSENMLKIIREAELHAYSDVPVLITGESGTGKELLARAIHRASPRARLPFTPVNMASVSDTLFESEFFGHTKGAFTGAEKERSGYLEQTNKGTLFMDEIGSVSPNLQGKLLRVLQEGEFIKLGASKAQRVDIRFIAATNQDLELQMRKGTFRKDLYYRLKGAWLHLPPLRQRQADVPLLIKKFLDESGRSADATGMDDEALVILLNHDYPGNIRELKSILQAASNIAQSRPISRKTLPDYLKIRKNKAMAPNNPQLEEVVPLAEVEKAHIRNAYYKTAKNKSLTAKLLGISLNTLRRKLEFYEIR